MERVKEAVELYLEVEGPVAEVGEPLETEAVAILFTEEETDEITALEVIGVSELLRELSC